MIIPILLKMTDTDPGFSWIQKSLILSSHILNQQPSQLSSHLFGRLSIKRQIL